MILIDKNTLRTQMNRYGQERTPFLWAASYNLEKCFLITDLDSQNEILWQVGSYGNTPALPQNSTSPELRIKNPVSRKEYAEMFSVVMQGLKRGDSFLTNLTAATEVECTGSLTDVFCNSSAPYRLMIPGEFVCFSPEPFVRIENSLISTFPMKGTADASLPDAEASLMSDYKELCEHYTIVDLMRNDLNSVVSDVRVARFRYIEEIATSSGSILQTSSEICGTIPQHLSYRFGDIILPMLPAGSITGAPKQATLRLIDNAETCPRGWYTGVFGYFDGLRMQTAVMIRCLQYSSSGRLFFHSGGGITVNSSEDDEYAELMAKVYLSK